MLDTRQLRYFATVARELHFGRAAQQLHIAQSALSLQVKALEQRLGVRLLNRGRKSLVTLTEAGAAFLAEVRIALRQIERAEAVGRQASRGEIGRVEIGYVVSAALSGLLPQTLATFRRSRPQVDVHLITMETPKQLTAIAEGVIDIGFIRPRPRYPEGVTATIVHGEPLLLAVAASHPLAVADFDIAELAGESFIIPQFDENVGFAEHLAGLAARGGFAPESTRRVRDFITAIGMAAAGYGVVPVPYSMRSLVMEGIVYRPIGGYLDEVQLAIAHRNCENAPVVQAFIKAAIGLRGQL